jgi:SAM-dependent methyltransferase
VRLAELAGGARARAVDTAAYLTVGQARSRRTFEVGGERFHYYSHPYNTTWTNERAVELPIVLAEMSKRAGARILEVGNVLAHYGISGHVVVDKYERAPGVHNLDMLDFKPDRPFDLIVSISTLEHVGFDEDVVDPDKPARALAHLRGLLAPGGLLLMTFALGYNHTLDAQLLAGSLPITELLYLRRISRDNRWVEATADECREVGYAAPYPRGNAIVALRASGFTR